MNSIPRILVRCTNCSCKSAAFNELSEEQLDRVDRHRSELRYRKGEILCKQGSFLSNMLFVKSGLVKIYVEFGDNHTFISIETNGHFIGLPSIFSKGDMIYHYSVEALTDTEVCVIDIATFKNLINENNKFAVEIIRVLNDEVLKGYKHMLSLSNKHIRGRFAELILHLKENIYKQNNFILSITRKDMGKLISTSQESISRMLKEFKDGGLIEMNNQEMKIMDEEKLNYLSKVG